LKKKADPADKKGKELKKWSRKYKLLFVSETLVRQLPKLGGPLLTKWGKFPTVVMNNEDVKNKVDEGKFFFLINLIRYVICEIPIEKSTLLRSCRWSRQNDRRTNKTKCYYVSQFLSLSIKKRMEQCQKSLH
jgi:hypothetical protein